MDIRLMEVLIDFFSIFYPFLLLFYPISLEIQQTIRSHYHVTKIVSILQLTQRMDKIQVLSLWLPAKAEKDYLVGAEIPVPLLNRITWIRNYPYASTIPPQHLPVPFVKNRHEIKDIQGGVAHVFLCTLMDNQSHIPTLSP